MLVKIKNKVYNSADTPILLIISDDEKKLIAEMDQGEHRFCSFPSELDILCVKKFMELGNAKELMSFETSK